MPGEDALYQAPIWPGQLVIGPRHDSGPVATLADIMARLGLADTDAVAAMVRGWEQWLAVLRPDLVIAEFAPMLTLAAQGRCPSLAIGTGFSMPPADMVSFPSLNGLPPAEDEAALLDGVNRAMRRLGRATLPTLPALFAATSALASSFVEFDPYADWRSSPLGPPTCHRAQRIGDGQGDEIFLYDSLPAPRPNHFWQALVDCGLPVRIYAPALVAADRAILARAGLLVEPAPVSFDDIARRSRLIITHGGLGLCCSALLSAVPMLVFPTDLEKRIHADALVAMGLGVKGEAESTTSADLVAQIRQIYDDRALHHRVIAAAPDFQARMVVDPFQAIAQAANAALKL